MAPGAGGSTSERTAGGHHDTSRHRERRLGLARHPSAPSDCTNDEGSGGYPPDPFDQNEAGKERDDLPIDSVEQAHALASGALPLPVKKRLIAANAPTTATRIALPNFCNSPVFANTAPAPPATSAVRP